MSRYIHFFTFSLLAIALVSTVSYAKDSLKDAISFKSQDGNFTFKPKFRIHADQANYDDDVTKLEDHFELRRLRVGFNGTVMKDWTYSYNYDFESNAGYRVKSANIGYKGFDDLKLTLGNIQQPFSLEELTSSNHITFMERSLANVFAPSYTLGATAKTWGKHWSFTGGYFEDTLANHHQNNNGGHSIAARGTFTPIDNKRLKVHLGASGVFRKVGSNQLIQYSTRPESHPANVKLLSTGSLSDVDDISTLGLEALIIKGPWLVQGEIMQSKLDRKTNTDPTFDGGYIQGSWIITGEKHRYSSKNGILKQIRPKSPYGAVELAVRYSALDLQDATVTGGEENNLTLGVNWYINRNLRLMLNYIKINASPNKNGINEDADVIQMRIQAFL